MGRRRKLVLPRGAAVASEDVSPTRSGSNRRFYTAEFKRQLVEMVRGGRTPEDLAKDYEPAAQTIRTWVAQADRDEGRRSDGLTTDEREELNRLRRENRRLQEEKEILKKAAAWFAQESTSTPPKRSGS
jgi:transposase